jgi:hypothetical protein
MFSCTVAASQVKYPLNVIALFPTQNCAAIKPKSFVESWKLMKLNDYIDRHKILVLIENN